APPPLPLEGVTVRYETYSGGFFSPWTIDVRETHDGRGAKVAVVYDPGLIATGAAARVMRCLRNLLSYSIRDGAQPLCKLPLVDEQERRRLLVTLNDNAMPLPAEATLATLCSQQAERTPDAVAVTCGTDSIDYRELHLRAAQLAARLARAGVGPEVIVG